MAPEPESAERLYAVARSHAAEGRAEDARTVLNQAVQTGYATDDMLAMLRGAIRAPSDQAVAIASLRAGLQWRPRVPAYRFHLAELLRAEGEWVEAAELLNELCLEYPNERGVLLALLRTWFALGESQNALARLRNIVDPDTEDAEWCFFYGIAHAQSHAHAEARGYFERCVAAAPTYIPGWVYLAATCLALDARDEAIDAGQRALALDAQYAPAHLQLARAYLAKGEVDRAGEHLRTVLANVPDHALAHALLASVSTLQFDVPSARHHMNEALRLGPENAEVQLAAGELFLAMGEPAEASYRSAVEADPALSAAYIGWSRSRRFSGSDDEVVVRLRAAISDDGLPDSARTAARFALAKVLDDRGDYEAAYRELTQGNRERFERMQFNTDAYRDEVCDRVAMAIPSADAGEMGHQPIFIVGMPRSATTLVERILSRHSVVLAGGELEIIPTLWSDWHAGGADPHQELGHYSVQYQRAIPTNGQRDGCRVTDKLPGNYLYLGWIAAVFPNAALIHCVRDPLDVCLSNFMHHYADGHHYSYDIDALACVYAGYECLMTHWRQRLSDRIYDVEYEALVRAPESEIPKLTAACRLEWEPACLSPHEAQSAVMTASRAQVREPINRRGLDRAQNYPEFGERFAIALARERDRYRRSIPRQLPES
ncbi:MAG: sulfotransferase [Pseudomonadota bacterium]